ncbi:hypothetical protein ACZ11_09670 [Lysinibacillus xylanilyticus]|uniref:Uncharacterized protein n=1 Tax=Lysinibacillus xylanilyticus TaxID=582475 RepID=A0A0K9FDR1_9BACI|nr:hypothetical protein [Lysinibacillus xylanilyticus]KMY32387.1 hypothetical protein ACZ11_09670 [Lysinibacillus xylanilyticus]
MNFDTKYLIRWGIPGWIFLMTVLPYLFFVFNDDVLKSLGKVNDLALGAAITLIGIPLGYFFNQLHHFTFWVTNKKNWGSYFEKEVILDMYLSKTENEGYKERYRYL